MERCLSFRGRPPAFPRCLLQSGRTLRMNLLCLLPYDQSLRTDLLTREEAFRLFFISSQEKNGNRLRIGQLLHERVREDIQGTYQYGCRAVECR